MYKMFIVAAIGACVATVSLTPVYAADEPVVVMSRFFVTPGKEAIFEERNRKIVERVRKTEPNLSASAIKDEPITVRLLSGLSVSGRT